MLTISPSGFISITDVDITCDTAFSLSDRSSKALLFSLTTVLEGVTLIIYLSSLTSMVSNVIIPFENY